MVARFGDGAVRPCDLPHCPTTSISLLPAGGGAELLRWRLAGRSPISSPGSRLRGKKADWQRRPGNTSIPSRNWQAAQPRASCLSYEEWLDTLVAAGLTIETAETLDKRLTFGDIWAAATRRRCQTRLRVLLLRARSLQPRRPADPYRVNDVPACARVVCGAEGSLERRNLVFRRNRAGVPKRLLESMPDDSGNGPHFRANRSIPRAAQHDESHD